MVEIKREFVERVVEKLSEYADRLESGETLNQNERFRVNAPYGYVEVSPRDEETVVVELVNHESSPSWHGRWTIYKKAKNELGFSASQDIQRVTMEIVLTME